MKTVILCGGLGTRLAEETRLIPKPMVRIGGKPILIHILEVYYKHGFKDFILALGYKSNIIQSYFKKNKFPFKVKTVFTGNKTLTGTRLFKLKKLLINEKNFMLTYGDGLTNQNIKYLLKYHLRHKKVATMTVVRPPVRFGEVYLKGNRVFSFKEKPQITTGWINGGFFVFSSKIFNFLSKKNQMLEKQAMEKLTQKGQLMAFKHTGFWQCMDNIRDKNILNELIRSKKALWMI
jgi:glucose-1-phosphate cytidylyltransferase